LPTTKIEATENILLTPKEQNSGVSKALDYRDFRLLSLRETPVPKSILANRSREQRNDHPEYIEAYNKVSSKITKLLRNKTTFP
jgi:hypothetical protein